MTINDIILRDMAEAVFEAAGVVAFVVLIVVLFWLYLAVTPDQYSAECEALRAEMEAQGE